MLYVTPEQCATPTFQSLLERLVKYKKLECYAPKTEFASKSNLCPECQLKKPKIIKLFKEKPKKQKEPQIVKKPTSQLTNFFKAVKPQNHPDNDLIIRDRDDPAQEDDQKEKDYNDMTYEEKKEIQDKMRAILKAQGRLKQSKYYHEHDVDECKGCSNPTMDKCDECGQHCCKKLCLVECVDCDSFYCEECADNEEVGIVCGDCGYFSCCEIDCSICAMKK